MFLTAPFLMTRNYSSPVMYLCCLLDYCASRSCQQTGVSPRIPLPHNTVICEHLRTGKPRYLPQHLTDYSWPWTRLGLECRHLRSQKSKYSPWKIQQPALGISRFNQPWIQKSIWHPWLRINPQMLRANNLLKKLCRSGLVQFKPGLFKGHLYINWICRLEKGIFTQQ